MGTRADFYVGTGTEAEWLRSIAFDGYRIDEMEEKHANGGDNLACWQIKTAKSEDEYRAAVATLLAINDDATLPEHGWPWPWNDSTTTDYAYAFSGGVCKTFSWGRGADWPDMSERKNVTFGPRSGVIVVG